MFLQMARAAGDPERVLQRHPAELTALLEAAWSGQTPRLSPVPSLLEALRGDVGGVVGNRPERRSIAWHHLIYAYMIENTRVFEIFRRIVSEFSHGEKLEAASPGGQRWLRATEELFFRDPPPFTVFTLTSHVRPDSRAVRRNAYYRMFGLDLNHGTDDGRPYAYEKAVASNREFVSTLEELLREVWRGIVNFNNTSGPNSTDADAIASLARRLHDMLVARRRNGNLAREEFWAVATLSWFHLTVDSDTQIVRDLKAEAPSPEERLRKAGQRVGLAPHGKAHHFFELAEPLAVFLREIEANAFSQPATAVTLFSPSPVRDQMLTILNRYSLATGRDLKAGAVTLTARA